MKNWRQFVNFRAGLVWTVGLTVEMKRRFQIPLAWSEPCVKTLRGYHTNWLLRYGVQWSLLLLFPVRFGYVYLHFDHCKTTLRAESPSIFLDRKRLCSQGAVKRKRIVIWLLSLFPRYIRASSATLSIRDFPWSVSHACYRLRFFVLIG